MLACTRGKAAPGEAREPQIATTVAPSPNLPSGDRALVMDTGANLSQVLGEDTLTIVRDSEQVMFAELRSVAADEAQEIGSLMDERRIAGYPMTTALRPLDAATARTLKRSLLEGRNYAPTLSRRCFAERFVGFRFTRHGERVDAMLTDPCWAVLWMFTRDTHPELWRSHFSRTLIEEVLAAVPGPQVAR